MDFIKVQRFRKFLIWGIIMGLYVSIVFLLANPGFEFLSGIVKKGGITGGYAVTPGVSHLVRVKVTRANGQYWVIPFTKFGLIRVPRYILNNVFIDSINRIFFNSMFATLISFIIWEVILYFRSNEMIISITDNDGNVIAKISKKELNKLTLKDLERFDKKRDVNKKKEVKNMDWKKVLKRLGIGLGLMFLCLLFGNSPAIAVLILVLYHEFKKE
ncbi:MAG: hypothetical protein ACTSW1_00730 [Candidatus Hodarchaeales archaeon]